MAISRDDLYKLVWSTPVSIAAKQFAVSGSYLARVCQALDVPRPPRGYWAMRGAGRSRPQPPLPEARPGTPNAWAKGNAAIRMPAPRLCLPRASRPKRVARVHELIASAAEHFRCAEPGINGYLKPRKKLLVDVTASKSGLEKCLRFADELFNRLEAFGLHVVIAPAHERFIRPAIEVREEPGADDFASLWSPLRATVVYFGTVAIGLAVVETLESVRMRYVGEGQFVREEDVNPTLDLPAALTWRAVKQVPSGRLKLIAYSPFFAFPWKLEWQETANTPLDRIIDVIAARLEAGAFELAGKLERGHSPS